MERAKKIVQWIGAIIFALLSVMMFGGASTFDNADMQGTTRWMAIFFLAMAAIFALCAISPRKRAQEKKAQEQTERLMRRIDEVSSVNELPVVETPLSIILSPGEICHYQTHASVVTIKEQVVGYTSGSSGVSVRLAKGLTVHSGSSRGRPIREDVEKEFPGIFSVTNKRIIMTGEKGFEYSLNKLTAIEPWHIYDGLLLQFGRTVHIVSMEEPYWVPKILELFGNSQ